MRLTLKHNRFLVLLLVCAMISSFMLPNLKVNAAITTPYGTLQEGEEVIFLDAFDDATLYDAAVTTKQAITTPWIQEGGSSLAKVSATSTHTAPNRVKLDSTDSMSVQLITSGYENIKVYYTSSKGSYTSGSVIVEYSPDGGTTWVNIEEFTGNDSDINSSKIKSLGSDANNIGNLKVRFKVGTAISGNLYIDTIMVTGTPTQSGSPTPTLTPTPTPTPSLYPVTGSELQLFTDNFDDPDAYGTTGNIEIPAPWIQENKSSLAKTAASGAHTLPNRVKIDASDSLALALDTRAYANIKINYTTSKGTYTSGSVVVEYSIDGGTTWTLIEEFRGTDTDIATSKTKMLGNEAFNNASLKVRFRVGESLTGSNLYFDSFSVTGQLIEGMTPVGPVVSEPVPTPVPPYTPPAGVKFYQDVEIGMAGANKLYTSIAVPEVPSSTPMPVLVYIHGGGWNHGSRTENFSKISGYVSKGYIGVALDYRLTPEAPFPAQIQDVKLAIRYLRANASLYNLDPDRIGVWGSSAGGHLASLLGTTSDLLSTEQIALDNGHTVNAPDMEGTGGYAEYSDRVQAIVDFSGPADFTTDFSNNYSSVTKLLGANAFSVPDLARLVMPGTYASSDDPPFFIRHGDADVTIPYTDSVKLYEQLVAANVSVIDYKIVAGQGHGFTGEAATTANNEAWAFLDQYVKNKVVTENIMYKPGYTPTPTPIPTPTQTPTPEGISVIINTSEVSLNVGDTQQLTATVTPTEPAKTVTWYTYNSSVADVTSTGLVSAVGEGTTKIRAYYEDTVSGNVYFADCNVIVNNIPTPSAITVTLSSTSLTKYVGETQQLTAIVLPAEPAKTVTWYTYNSSVADVTSTGLVSAVGEGTTKIHAYYEDTVSGNVYFADCNVTVIKVTSGGGNPTPTPTPTPIIDLNKLIDETNGVEITLEIQKGENNAPAQAILPLEAIQKMQSKGIESIKIVTETATLFIAPDAFERNDISSVLIEVKQANKELDLTTAQQNIVGNNTVYDFKVITKNLDGSESSISKFIKPVEVVVPYSPAVGEDQRKITAFFIDNDGKLENVGGVYDTASGTVTFKTSHFSKYFVKYNNVSFVDLVNVSWAEDQIEVMASKGIINGTGENKYSPDNNITRGDFLLLLVKTLGLTATVDSNFSDVNSTDYYYEAIGIAKKLGLAKGTGNNTFEANKEISRQDMMVLVARAMKIAGKLQSTGTANDLQAFEDRNLVADYAAIDVATLVKESIVIGSGSNIEPLGNTTRAEAAVLLYRIYNK